jgi:hypothetical protein
MAVMPIVAHAASAGPRLEQRRTSGHSASHAAALSHTFKVLAPAK